MKRALFLSALAAACVVYFWSPVQAAKQPRPPWPTENGQVVFKEVVKVEGAQARTLYNRARAWFSETYVSAESVLDLDDPDAGRLIGKGILELPGMGAYVIRHRLTVEVKDGRYRYTLGPVTWTTGTIATQASARAMTDFSGMKGWLKRTKDEAAWARLNELIESLKAAMRSGDTEEW